MAQSLFDRVKAAIERIEGASWDPHDLVITATQAARPAVDEAMHNLGFKTMRGTGYQSTGGTVIYLR